MEGIASKSECLWNLISQQHSLPGLTNSVLTGDVALRIPETLAITLDRVFQDDAVAELLTTNKLSELACLTLYLMYEKKAGKESFWFEYIKVRLGCSVFRAQKDHPHCLTDII